jgi:type VI secretion system protein ImpC
MSAGEQEQQAAAEAQAEAQEAGLMDQVFAATKQTERSRAEELVRTLVAEVNRGTVSVGKDIIRTINSGISAIDEVVSKQLAAIMHHPSFQQLEGTWRGLHYLVMSLTRATSSRAFTRTNSACRAGSRTAP